VLIQEKNHQQAPGFKLEIDIFNFSISIALKFKQTPFVFHQNFTEKAKAYKWSLEVSLFRNKGTGSAG